MSEIWNLKWFAAENCPSTKGQGIGFNIIHSYNIQSEIQHPQASSKIDECLQRNCLLLCLQKVQTAHQRSKNALVACLAAHLGYIVMSHMLALCRIHRVSQLQHAAD